MKRVILSFTALIYVSLSTQSYAEDTASATIAVSANIQASCSIITTAMQFGSYDPTDTEALVATATVTSTCTAGASGDITMGEGINSVGSGSLDNPARRMVDESGDNHLSYQIYTDSALSAVWGNMPSSGVSYTGTGTPLITTAYGRVPALQSVSQGNFSDSIQVEINF